MPPTAFSAKKADNKAAPARYYKAQTFQTKPLSIEAELHALARA
jgi:hypothetical protein